jgi:hypothetical protein
MMCHGAALNGPDKASMLGSNRSVLRPREAVGIREKTNWVDFSQEL